MKKILIVLLSLMMVGCEENDEVDKVDEDVIVKKELSEMTIKEIVDSMTIQEKAGQMIQAERGSITKSEVRLFNIGSVLSGGGSVPSSNTADGWTDMVNDYQAEALDSSSRIPLLYGVDAVHGHNNYASAVLFPHNIGLGAANDSDLMKRIGIATTEQLRETGIHWNFSPSVAVAMDPRWGRFYESFGEDNTIHTNLVTSYIEGLQSNDIVATAKHYIGDGATLWNDDSNFYPIDRGDVEIEMDELRELYLKPYIEAIDAGVMTIMTSYNSVNGERMHGNTDLITTLLKEELGFSGFVVTDWEAIHDLDGNFYDQVVTAINAGNDMLMEPYAWKDARRNIIAGFENDDISEERINDAVTRILTVKKELGLFDNAYRETVEQSDHYELAREAVRKSSVLLKNDGTLPFQKDMNILLIGKGSDSIGIQSGGWSHSWQGSVEHDIPGSSLKDALSSLLSEFGGNIYTSIEDADKADVVILVLSEKPYAEGIGDNGTLLLDSNTGFEENITNLKLVNNLELPVVTVMMAGRPLIVTEYINGWNSFVMAHLPGSAAEGITDVLFGDFDFTGKLPYTWPSEISDDQNEPLFDFQDGLTYD